MQISSVELQGPSHEELSLRSIEALLRARVPCALGWSAGKDSSVAGNLVLTAAAKLAREGIRTPIVFLHSDTLVESPEVARLARREIRKIEAFMAKHGIVGRVMVGTPRLAETWAVRVLGGRALPAFPDSRRDCSKSWKIDVSEKNLAEARSWFVQKGFTHEPCVLTGVRLSESTERAAAMRGRGERSDRPWRNAEGRLMLSPIMEWELDDIWEYIGLCNAGVIDSYSDFGETMELYRDGGGTSCTVVSDMAMEKFSKPCSSRFGCWSCTAVARDVSLRNMISSNSERYGYMEPLARLRDFIADTQYDWDRRHFVQRTINDGYVTVGADTYSPAMLKELLQYTLTAQCESGVEIVSEVMLIAIDARWSLYALHPPFEALRVWLDVMEDGARYYPPKIDKPTPKTPVPVLGKIWVGEDWDDDTSPLYAEGLRHPAQEIFSETCGTELRVFKNGKLGLDLEEGETVDEESASDFFCFLAREKAETAVTASTRWTEGWWHYQVLGLIQPGKGQSSRIDEIMRRSSWRQDHDLHGQRSMDELYQRCDIRLPRQASLF